MKRHEYIKAFTYFDRATLLQQELIEKE